MPDSLRILTNLAESFRNSANPRKTLRTFKNLKEPSRVLSKRKLWTATLDAKRMSKWLSCQLVRAANKKSARCWRDVTLIPLLTTILRLDTHFRLAPFEVEPSRRATGSQVGSQGAGPGQERQPNKNVSTWNRCFWNEKEQQMRCLIHHLKLD